MMLRILLVLVALLGLSVGGCKKEEPTMADQMDAMKQEAEAAAEEAQPAAEEMAEEVEAMAEEAAGAME